MTTESAATGAVVPVSTDGPAVLDPRVVEAYEGMIADVPEAGGDGFEAILEAIAAASSAAELDAPWRSAGLEGLANVPIVVSGIRKMPSDYPGGLPWFLVVDAAVRATGERITVTTGSVGVVAQLVKAWSLDAFPLTVVPRMAARPSRSGYYPMHLEIVG